MKKSYETPSVEKIKFNYRDQVVAASGAGAVTGSGDVSGYNDELWDGCVSAGQVGDYFASSQFLDICDVINNA